MSNDCSVITYILESAKEGYGCSDISYVCISYKCILSVTSVVKYKITSSTPSFSIWSMMVNHMMILVNHMMKCCLEVKGMLGVIALALWSLMSNHSGSDH